MGLTQSCKKVPTNLPESPVLPTLKAYYTLPFSCHTVPADKTHTPSEQVFYAERWCSNPILWRALIENAMSEIVYKSAHPSMNYSRVKINGLQIHTSINGDSIIGDIQWACRDINIDLLNDILEVKNNDELYEKGIHFAEPFWTTSIICTQITKEIR